MASKCNGSNRPETLKHQQKKMMMKWVMKSKKFPQKIWALAMKAKMSTNFIIQRGKNCIKKRNRGLLLVIITKMKFYLTLWRLFIERLSLLMMRLKSIWIICIKNRKKVISSRPKKIYRIFKDMLTVLAKTVKR